MSRSSIHLAVLPIAAALAAAPGACAFSAAEAYVRAGDAVGALRALENPTPALSPAEVAFWRGRALVMLDRPEEALEAFREVPEGHALYPYAARGLLYCAWRSPNIDYARAAEPLTHSQDKNVSDLALASLAEHQLKYSNDGNSPAYDKLMTQVEQSSHPVLRLLKLLHYRNTKDYNGGIEYAKRLEQEEGEDLPPIMRQRVRLALAELYYAKEKEADTEGVENSDDGKGEETLLQFITANPESPLLQEAFLRLYRHSDSTGSEYARTKLRDWASDTAHPKRAVQALYTLQQMKSYSGADPAALANSAAGDLPGEPLTIAILQEQIRKLFTRNKSDEAELYLSLLSSLQKNADARSNFLQAWRHRNDYRESMRLFNLSAEGADGSLRTPALVNTLICAARAGENAVIDQLLASSHFAPAKRAMLLAHVGMQMQANPECARREVEEAKQLDPTSEQLVDIQLDLAQLSLTDSPLDVYNNFIEISKEERSSWTLNQQLRYAALLEKAADALQDKATQSADSLLERLYRESDTPAAQEQIGLRLAYRYTSTKRHRKALTLLLDLADKQPPGADRATTLLYAGHESALLGSLASLEQAVKLYAEAARQDSPLSVRATIEQAATLIRINRTEVALRLLRSVNRAKLSAPEQALLLTVLADAYGQEMTPQSLSKALELSEEITTIPGLPQSWISRGYLQHAALCARMNRSEEALADYRKTIRIEKETAQANDPHSCFLLYYAAGGAIYQLLLMERYEDAAILAEAAAAWPGTTKEPTLTPGPKSEAFRRWAQRIRQTHFLPIPVITGEGLSLQ